MCLVRFLTGVACPGCGFTHAFLAAGRGRWLESFAWHPLGPAAWLSCAAYFLKSLVARLRRSERPRIRGSYLLAAMLLLAITWGWRLLTGTLPGTPWRGIGP